MRTHPAGLLSFSHADLESVWADLTGSGLSDRSTCCAARRTPSSPTAPCYCSLWQRTTRVGGSAPPPTAWPQWGPGCSCSSWVGERCEPPLRVLATLKCPFAPCLEFLYLCCRSNACASDPPPTDKCGTSRDGLQTFHSGSLVEVLADVHQLLSCCLHYRNQSPRGHLHVHLSRGEAGKHILAGGLWWRISADIFSLVGVRKKTPTFSLGCNHGSHWQCWYCSIDVGEEEFIYLLSLLGSYNLKRKMIFFLKNGATCHTFCNTKGMLAASVKLPVFILAEK